MMCQLEFFVSLVTPFFLYVLSAQAYRKELVHLVRKVLQFRNGIQVHPTTNQQTITVLDTRLQRRETEV